MDFRIELVPLTVTDVDRAVRFYRRNGFELDGGAGSQDGDGMVELRTGWSSCGWCAQADLRREAARAYLRKR